MLRRRRRSILLAVLILATGFITGKLIIDSTDTSMAARDTVSQSSPLPKATSSTQVRTPSERQEPQASLPPVVDKGKGEWDYAKPDEDAGTIGHDGTLLKFKVAAEKGIHADVEKFSEAVAETLSDKRGWTASDDWRFQHTDDDWADFTIYLASPQTRKTMCGGDTYTSCRSGNNVVINMERWIEGVPHWKGPLASYRQYVVNHEVGHRLGEQHVVCPKKGELSPVMAQQTLEMRGCKENAWPYVDDEYVTGPSGEYN